MNYFIYFTVIALLSNLHVLANDFKPANRLKNLTLQKKKVFESDLTLLPLFFQLMYVQTPKRTDCFPNILVTLSGKDPRWMDIPKKIETVQQVKTTISQDYCLRPHQLNLTTVYFFFNESQSRISFIPAWLKTFNRFISHFFFFSYIKKLLMKHFGKQNFPSCRVVQNLFCPLN